MKKIILFIAIIGFAHFTNAQVKEPVGWAATAIKKSADTYEVVITATVSKPWHIYSQSTPDGGPVATQVSFAPNPLVKFDGKVKETGKMEKINDKVFGVQVFYFSDKVVYTQIVKLKGPVKTNINATVKFMVCDDTQCLPPAKKTFDIKLQ